MIFPEHRYTHRSRVLSCLFLAVAFLAVGLVSGAAGQTYEVDPALGIPQQGFPSIFLQQMYPGGPDTVGFDFEESIEGWDFIIPPDSIHVLGVCEDTCTFCWTVEETPRPHYFIYPWMEEPGTLRWVPAFKGFFNSDCDQEWQVKGISAPIDESWSCMQRFEVRLVNRIDRPVFARLGFRLKGTPDFEWPGSVEDWVLLTTDEWKVLGLDQPQPGMFDAVEEVAIMLGSWYAVGDVFIDRVEAVSFYYPGVEIRPTYTRPVTQGTTATFRVRADVSDDRDPVYTTGPLPDNATFKTVVENYTNRLIGELTFSPTLEQIGDHEITFYASVCQSVDSETVVISVVDYEPPVLDSIGPKWVDELQRLEFTIRAYDVNQDRITLTTSQLPANAHFYDQRQGSGRFVFEPNSQQVGVYPVTFYAADSTGSDSETIIITVNDVNLPPFVYEDGHRTIYENDSLTYTVTSYDLDGTVPFLFAYLSGTDTLARNMSFVDNRDNTGTLTFVPDSTQGGHYNAPNNFYVIFRAVDEKDPALFQNSATITLAVLDPNVPPQITSVTPRQVAEGETLYTEIQAVDDNGDNIVLSALILPSWSSFTDNGDGTGMIVSTPGYDQAGYHWVHLRASDGIDSSNMTFQFRVYNTNRVPQFVTEFEDVMILELDSYTISIEAFDPDGDALSIVGVDLPDGASVTDNGGGTGTFSFVSEYEHVGRQHHIVIQAADSALSVQAEFTITVDNQPLHVGQTGGDADVLIDSAIVIRFNELIDEATVAGNVSVTSAQGQVPVIVPVIQNEISVLRIQPSTGLFAQADTLDITISTGVLDRAGFPLSSPYAGTFTTGAGVFPGDTDNNGVVDERDILPIGRYFEISGPARAEQGTDFKLTPVHLTDASSTWSPYRAVYADADGSGEVNTDDVCAITDNWLFTTAPESTAVVRDRLDEIVSSLKGEVLAQIQESLADCPDTPGRAALIEALGGSGGDDGGALPTRHELSQNYPNPFNPTTTIQYGLPVGGEVNLTIYNVVGQKVVVLVDRYEPAGYHTAVWDGRDSGGARAASGVYLYRLETGQVVLTRRMLLLK